MYNQLTARFKANGPVKDISRFVMLASVVLQATIVACSSQVSAQQQTIVEVQSEADHGHELQKLLGTAENDMNSAFNKALRSFAPSPKEESDMARLPKEDRVRQIEWNKRMIRDLRASQQRWAEYRNASCQSVSDFYEDGSGEPNAVASCKLMLTEGRTKFLQEFFGVQK